MTRTGAGPLACERHGTPTRLTCAECNTPICPECLVKTPVGLKCPLDAEAVTAPRARSRRDPARTALAVVGVLAVLGGLVALGQILGRSSGSDGGSPEGPAVPPPDRILTPQVAVMAADGSDKRVLSTRSFAFDGSPAWSPDGSRLAFESVYDGRRSIWSMQADGQGLRRVTDGAGADGAPSWSPDGGRIAFMSDRDADMEIYVVRPDGQELRRLTDSPGFDGYPAWTPDGARIAFVSDRDGGLRVWIMNADGSAPARLLDVPAVPDRPSFSRDGTRLAFVSDRDGNPEVYLTRIGGTNTGGLTRLTDSPGADGEPALSPDGSRLLFASDRDGTPAVYSAALDGGDVRKLTTGPRGYAPAWAPDGRTIAYVSDAGAPRS